MSNDRRDRTGTSGRVLVATLAVVLLAEVAVRVMADRLPEPQVWSTPEIQYKVDLMRDHPPVDVAFVGSSVVDVAVGPDRLDRTAFNAALGAASIGMIADFTRHVTVPELDPAAVVIGVASRELNVNSPEPRNIEARFRDAPAVRDALDAEMPLDRIDRWLRDVSALFEYRSVLRDPGNWLGDRPPAWGADLTSGSGQYLGFLDASYRFDPALRQQIADGALHDFRIGEDEVASLRRLISSLRAEGRQVLVLTTPVTSGYLSLYPPGGDDHDAFVEAVASVANEEGVSFLDTGVWAEELFADPLHVNRAGAERLTALVEDWIEARVP